MRFDPDRVLRLAREWPSPRPKGSEEARRAAAMIAEEFQRAGLRAEQGDDPPGPRAPARPARRDDVVGKVASKADSLLRVVIVSRLTTARASWVLMRRVARPVREDNRTGLALLAELALTWPKSVGDRVETWFVATPNPPAWWGLGAANPIAPGGATLILMLDSPGVGDHLGLSGDRQSIRLAEAAARDLWVPYRLGLTRPRFGVSAIRLRGDSANRPINPALLAATAQLVTEIALRWAKETDPLREGAKII